MYLFGTEEYMEQTIRTHSESMFRAAFALLKNESDAQDAVQEAFLRLIEKDPFFRDDEHEKAWLLRVTINISKNMLKAAYRKNLPLQEEIVFEGETTDEVLSCVLTLPENYRTVIHLYYYEGYSIKEIASILKLPSATVGTRLSRARNLLEKSLKGDCEI